MDDLALLEKADTPAQDLAALLAARTPEDQDRLLQDLKQRADQLMRTDIQRCLQVVDRMAELAEITGNPLHRALALLARANAFTIVLGEYRQAVDCYNQAAEIYAASGLPVEQARSQIGKIFALANLGRYSEALSDGAWARDVLRKHGEWMLLAKLMVNLAIIPGRLGQDAEALEMFDQAGEAYRRLGLEGEPHWLRLQTNRAVVLRNLGRFSESIQASQMALDAHRLRGEEVAAARAQQNLAVTYFVQGKYNEALALLDQAREVLLRDGRQRHAMLVELFISDCLLQLRRFPDVLEKSRQVRLLFGELGTRYEVGQAILNEASAYIGLVRNADALASLDEARRLFEAEGNRVAVADVDLQVAVVLLSQDQAGQCLDLAMQSAAVYQEHDLPVWQARACLVAGRAALALDQAQQAGSLAARALQLGQEHSLPALTFSSHHLLGQIALRMGKPEDGLAAYERAIQDLEQLSGQLMVEFRADFIADKERIYQDAVALCLDLNQDRRGLEYAERAKSRALLDLLAHRLDLSITARSPADQPLVDELLALRLDRDRFYRRIETGEGFGQRGETTQLQEERLLTEGKVLEIEKRITGLWHKLLIRNADYARDAALWQVRVEPVQPYLEPGTLLLEYFAVQGQLVVFQVTPDAVTSTRLPASLDDVQRLLQLFWLNLRSVPRSPAGRLPTLERNAQGVLERLYRLLLAPISPVIEAARRLVIVPHGPLHYLPFQALYDGQAYLLERAEITYLPGSSFLRYSLENRPGGEGLLAVGLSLEGRLPHAVEEARSIAALWPGQALVEAQAALEPVRQEVPSRRILHLATHGDFRPDNPLFSGLALADGWLTTLDIFNLRLDASLVTLSACQTGRSIVAGGDELLGLMRAFLAAGAASLVSTLWAVEDFSTAQLMLSFYRLLAGSPPGASVRITKAAALRQAQLDLYRSHVAYRHPYFWAPFFLAGAPGEL